jgi:hypothetical protein
MAQRAGWGVGAWIRSVRRYVGYLIAGLSLAAPESIEGITQRRDGAESRCCKLFQIRLNIQNRFEIILRVFIEVWGCHVYVYL